MHPRDCISHETAYTDILFTVFDAKTWACWQSLLDLDMNPFGWGHDMTVGDMCDAKIGVSDQVRAYHNEVEERTYGEEEALEQMWNWVNHVAEVYEKEHHKVLPDYAELDEKEVEGSLARFKGKKHNYLDGATKAELYRYRVIERYQKYPHCHNDADVSRHFKAIS